MGDHATWRSARTDGHDARVAELRDLIRMAEEEIAVHEALIRLARDERLLRRVAACSADGMPTQAALVDLEAACRVADLPDDAVLDEVRRGEADGIVSASLRCRTWTVEVGWHPEDGPFARPDTRFMKLRRAVLRAVDDDRRREATEIDARTRGEDRCR